MQNDSLFFLATKTMPPRRARGVMPRPRLNGLAAELTQHLLTVVKAPPGYGKTTLALAWSDEASAAGAAVAWLSLDPPDNDAARFTFYIASALGRAGIALPSLRPDMLAPLCVAAPQRVMALLLNAIAEQPRELCLFLDDSHCLDDAAVLELLALLCRRAPINLHLVLLGRSEAPHALLSQVAADELFELDATALRFDLGETTQLMGRLRGEGAAPAADIHALHGITEGWPAAVRAIMLSLAAPVHGGKGWPLGKWALPNRPISALMEDVLDHVPARLIDFMVRIAVVEKVCADLARVLSGMDDAALLLDQVGQRQLFISARDHEQRWFSMHPLFRDQLLRRLEGAGEAALHALHRRAADWFAERQLWAQAVGHALQAGEHARAIAWIEQCAMQLVRSGDLPTLISWQSQLRTHLLEMPLRLKLAFAWGLAHAMASAEARRLLHGIESALGSDDAADAMRWECKAVHALVSNVDDDGSAAGELARRCLAQSPPDPWVRNVLLNIVATTYLRTGQWPEFYAVPPLLLAENGAMGAGDFVFNRCYHLCYRGIAEYHQGRLDEAGLLFEQAMHIGDTQPAQFGITAAPERAVWVLPAALLAQARYQQGRLDEAQALVGDCLELARIVAPLDFVAAAYQTGVRLAHIRGDRARAAQLTENADALARARGWARLEAMNLLERTRQCLLADRVAEAQGCLQRLDTLVMQARGNDVRKAYIARDAFLARAWVNWAQGTSGATLAELGKRFRGAVAARLPLEVARLGMTLALAHSQLGQAADATASLRIACEHAAPAGAVRVLFDLPTPPAVLEQMLATLRRQLPSASPVALFLARMPAVSAAAARPPAVSPRAAVEGLSSRERHILTLIAQGQSNKEIARALGVAPDTIKYHLKSVFAKLGVGNRAQAAVQAQAHGLA